MRTRRLVLVLIAVTATFCSGAAAEAFGSDLTGSPFTQTGSWTVIHSPNLSTSQNGLSGVTCQTSSSCWAVGNYRATDPEVDKPLIEHWNGSSWSVSPSASPSSPTADASLYGVACGSPSSCWASGSGDVAGFAQAYIEHWDGQSWSQASVPAVTMAAFYGMTCASVNERWAVGSQGNYPLIEQWNGVTWSVPSVQAPNGDYGGLSGVTCVSASEC